MTRSEYDAIISDLNENLIMLQILGLNDLFISTYIQRENIIKQFGVR